MKPILGAVVSLAAICAAAEPALAAKPKLSVADVSVSESAGSATVAVALSKKAKRKVSVRYATTDGSATAGLDYAGSAAKLKIAARKRSATIEVPLIGDAIDESEETFELVLDGPKRAKLADPNGTVTIADDDLPPTGSVDVSPTVSLITASVPEGTSGNHVRTVGVGLSAPSAKPITVEFATAAGSAASPADFLAASGSLSFPPGQTSQSFNLTTVGDYGDEPDESLTVGFSAPVNVTLPGSTQSLTIADDDPACVAEDAPAAALVLGTISGDTGSPSPSIERVDQISPCGDGDWFRFTLREDSSANKDLTGVITLDHVPNDSPSGGDVDLCARIGLAGTDVCSENAGDLDEQITVCIDDPILGGADNTTEFFVEVDGFGDAVADYTLTMVSNIALGGPADLGNC